MKTRALTPQIGTLVEDIRVAEVLANSAQAETLRRLLDDRQVIFFHDQHLSIQELVQVARIFGHVQPMNAFLQHPPESEYVEILETKGAQKGVDVWHVDQSYEQKAPLGTVLTAIDVPTVGGDTIWSSMTAAWESLDSALQRYLETLSAEHNWEVGYVRQRIMRAPDGEARYQKERNERPPVVHPLVRIHPQTGKKILYVNSLYTTSIVGLERSHSDHLLASL
jgi:taurine dioxygenase